MCRAVAGGQWEVELSAVRDEGRTQLSASKKSSAADDSLRWPKGPADPRGKSSTALGFPPACGRRHLHVLHLH